MKKALCYLLVLLLCVSFASPAVMAAEGTLQLELRLSGEPQVGKELTVELWCESNPGLLSVQLTLAYASDVLDCTGCETGKVLRKMTSATNPDSAKGAIIAAAGVNPTEEDGLLATFTFTVLQAGDCGFALQDTTFFDADGEKLAFTVSGADVFVEAVTPTEPSTPTTTKPATTTAATTAATTATEKVEEPKQITLTDVSGHWAEEYLVEGIARQILQGYPDNTCRPDEAVTRAQFVTFVWRSVGNPTTSTATTFTDIEKTSYYYDAVAWAQQAGYILGVGDNRFLPDDPISREEVALFLWRVAGGVSGTERMFTSTYDKLFADSGDTSAWAKSAVYWAIYNEVWCGVGAVKAGNILGAKRDASRAEIVVMMVNYQDKIGE